MLSVPALLLMAAASPPPMLTREADGSVILHRTIHSDQPSLPRLTGGLIEGPCPARRCSDAKARSPRRDRAERAFEEAIDQARKAREGL